MQNIKTKEVITYMTMPRVVPRLKGLFASGFGYLSFLMAHVYKIVRLIPDNHPYLLTENIGRYGIRHVIAEAAGNLKFSFRNIDQIIIFVALLAGLVMMMVQIALLCYAIFVTPSMAASWFDTTNPQFDIAFNLLDQIFGIPDIYCSTSAPASCTDYAALYLLPMPYHSALHGLFQFYSTGLLLIGVLIFLYFIIVIIVETAVTGTPFGQRFQNVWVPVRLVVAIGLLMPIQYGINSGQYIVLYAAKYGSGLATNAWIGYNDAVSSHAIFGGNGRPLGEPYSHLALPEAPDITPLLEAMSLVHACAYSYHRLNGGQGASLKTNNTRGDGTNYPNINANYASNANTDPWEFQVQPFLVKTRTAGLPNGPLGTSPIFGDDSERIWIQDATSVPYFSGAAGNALGFYYGGDIVIRFGEFRVTGANPSNPQYPGHTGYVKPLCGDVRVPISDLTDPGGSLGGRGGADHMQRFYYDTVLDLWFNEPMLRQIGRTLVEHHIENNSARIAEVCSGVEGGGLNLSAVGLTDANLATAADCEARAPDGDWRSWFIGDRTITLQSEILTAWENYVLNSTYADFDASISSRGWGGAGIWYNKIAEINGGWMDGVRGVPYMDKYPDIMEQVKAYRIQNNHDTSPLELFNPSIRAEGENSAPKTVKVEAPPIEVNQIAQPLYRVFMYWNPPTGGKNGDEVDEIPQENILINAIHLLLGTTGLAEIRRGNKYLHPLAQLVAVGKGLVNSAVFNMAASSVSAFLGGALRAMDKTNGIAAVSEAASKVFYSTAFLGLTAGFVLFYVLPFLPFLYFYFAVASWVKAIFEAMLGAPLWALAHLRIDGEGLPGDAASNGYFLILEIFVRPILTVFGLLAAIIIFATQVRILNLIWDQVVVNAAGFTRVADISGEAVDLNYIDLQRGILDQFFFTLVYAIVCYMLALASFKLIDKIPDNILRWAGAGVSSYGDIDQDQVESLSRYAATGGMTIGSQATQAVTSASEALGGAVGKELKDFMGNGRTNPPAGS